MYSDQNEKGEIEKIKVIIAGHIIFEGGGEK
jgi:hypothetical protein